MILFTFMRANVCHTRNQDHKLNTNVNSDTYTATKTVMHIFVIFEIDPYVV